MLYKLLLRNDPRFLKLRISFSLSASYRKFILFFFFCSFITLAKPILPTVLAIQQHQRGKEIAVIWQSRQNIYFFFCLRHFTSFIFAGFHQDRIIFLLENLYFGFPFFFFFFLRLQVTTISRSFQSLKGKECSLPLLSHTIF